MNYQLRTRLFFFLSFLFVLTSQLTMVAQNCSGGSIWLSSQADIDNFQLNYGPCTDFQGSLNIDDNLGNGVADITNLQGLSGLTHIHLNLNIANCPLLQNLDGLETIQSVGREFFIQNNEQLTNLNGLSGLSLVVLGLRIINNDSLVDLSDISNVVVGTLIYQDNDGMTGLSFPTGLTMQSIIVAYNNSLLNIDLSNIQLTGLSAISIANNNLLTSIIGSNNLLSISNLSVNFNPNLTSVTNFSSLTSVSQGITIHANDALTDLSGLSNVQTMGNALIGNNDSLANLNDLSSLLHMEVLDLDGNDNMVDIGLPNLSCISGYLRIVSHTALTNIGLPNLQQVGSIRIFFNDLLQNLNDFSGVNNGLYQLWIHGNAQLTDISGLSGITTALDLDIVNNPMLAACCSICQLVGASHSVLIANNAASCDSPNDLSSCLNCIPNPKIIVDVRAALGGCFDESPLVSVFLMETDLNKSNLIPTLEPYSALGGFNVIGSGGETINLCGSPSFIPSDIVDWVFLELRDLAGTVVETQAALLTMRGNVVSADYTPFVEFNSSPTSSYNIAIRHRNHLGVVTTSPISFSGGVVKIVDFTSLFANVATDAMQVQTAITHSGNTYDRHVLWPGNGNGDGQVVYQGSGSDILPITSVVFSDPVNTGFQLTYPSLGYHLGDYNMDGQVIYQGAGSDILEITQSVFSNPQNTFFQSTFPVLGF